MSLGNQSTSVKSVIEICRKEKLLEQIVTQLDQIKVLTLDYILLKFQQCNQLRQDGIFLRNLFDCHSEIVLEMIEWLFTPEKIIKRKVKKLSQQQEKYFHSFPYLCYVFISDNFPFFQEIHRSSRIQLIPISLWFNFLFSQQFDEDKACTSLGYFKDIFLAFATNEYHAPINRFQMNLSESLSFGKVAQNLIHEKHTALSIFTDLLINDLIKVSHIQSVFLVLARLVVFSLLDPSVSKRAEEILGLLCEKAKTDDKVLSNLCIFSQQILTNIEMERFHRGAIILLKIIQKNIVNSSIKRILKSNLLKQKQWDEDQKDSQEQKIEYHLKFLIFILKVFNTIAKQIQNVRFQSKTTDQDLENQQQTQNQSKKQENKKNCQIFHVYNKLQEQVKDIINNLSSLSALIKVHQASTLNFSNGQSIIPITFMKFNYFELLFKCLQILINNPNKYSVKIEDLKLFTLIQKYLSQNKWNNITQKLLQKIAGLLIIGNQNLFKQCKLTEKIEVGNNFLYFLIDNFLNKDYVFLNSFHLTNFGNLHSIYKIAKAVAFQLQKNNKLTSLFQNCQPWKKFILQNLKNYQQKITNGIIVQPCNYSNTEEIKIDQVQPLKKLISKIKTNQKWDNKFKKNRIFRQNSQGKVFSKAQVNLQNRDLCKKIEIKNSIKTNEQNNKIFKQCDKKLNEMF